jgi:hypothetical protein
MVRNCILNIYTYVYNFFQKKNLKGKPYMVKIGCKNFKKLLKLVVKSCLLKSFESRKVVNTP